jgi:hypothetical protein
VKVLETEGQRSTWTENSELREENLKKVDGKFKAEKTLKCGYISGLIFYTN